MAFCWNINLWGWYSWKVSCKVGKKNSPFGPNQHLFFMRTRERKNTFILCSNMEQTAYYDLEEAREEFPYLIEPFIKIVKQSQQ